LGVARSTKGPAAFQSTKALCHAFGTVTALDPQVCT